MVKRDAGQYTFLCVQNTLSTISAAVFCETNPTTEQIKAAEELRAKLLARNRLKTLKGPGIKWHATGSGQ